MLRKVLLSFGLILLACATSFAQNSTTVSGQITDLAGQSWNNGTFNFVFVPSTVNPVGPYTWPGGAIPANIGGTLNGTGGYSVSIPSNTAISPIQSSWTVTFCPQASSPCVTLRNLAITGATQTVNATPPAILINLSQSVPPVLAYADSEITGVVLGSQYFNLPGAALKTCTVVSGANCTTWFTAGNATNATNLAGPGTITGMYTGNGSLGLSGTETIGQWNGNCIVDGVRNTTLAAAITCASSSGVIEIPMFSVPSFTTATIPAGVTLRFDGPSCLNNSGTLTVNGPIIAGNYQIFCGAGTVVLGAPSNPANVLWFPGATADVQINNCVASIPAIGGACDARGYGASLQTIAATATIGTTTKTTTLVMDRITQFQCSITNNTWCWQINPGSSMTAVGSSGVVTTNQYGLFTTGGASIAGQILIANQSGALNGFSLENITIQGNSAATVSDSVVKVLNGLQIGTIRELTVNGYSNTYLMKITQSVGGASGPVNYYNLDLQCSYLTGCKPLLIQGVASGGVIMGQNFYGGSFVHPGSGGLAIIDIEGVGSADVSGVNFYGPQLESGNTTDLGFKIGSATAVAIHDPVFTSGINGAGTTCVSIANSANTDGITVTGMNDFNQWTNIIVNAINSHTITSATRWGGNYYFSRSANTNTFDNAAGTVLTLDTNGMSQVLSGTANPAAAGFIRFAKSDTIHYRNNANTADLQVFTLDGSDNLLIGGTGVSGIKYQNGLLSGTAGSIDVGSTSNPFGNLWLGTAATNNFKFAPSSTTGARIINIPDFGVNASTTQNFPNTVILTSQYTNSTTGFTNVAGGTTLAFPVAANTNYTATCHLYYQAAATGGLNIEFTGPASPTAVAYGLDDPSAATTFNSSVATAFGTSLGQVVGTATTNFDAVVSFSLVNGANAGTVNLLAKSSAAVQLQIQAGSFCRVQ